MSCACEIDWSARAAWVQAIFSVVAILVAIWLPSQERSKQRTHEFQTQQAALLAIARRASATVSRLSDKTISGVIPKPEVGRLREEVEAITAVAEGVDLTSLVESSLIDAFVDVQEACRTTARRLRYQIRNARGPNGTPETGVPIDLQKYSDPKAAIAAAILRLENAVQAKR